MPCPEEYFGNLPTKNRSAPIGGSRSCVLPSLLHFYGLVKPCASDMK